MFVHHKQGLFLSENVDDIKMAGRKQNVAPMWKKLMKEVELEEPTSFLDHVYWGCTQRECKPNETKAWSYDMEGMLKNALSDTVNWQTRKWSSFTKFQVLASMIINSSRKNSNQLENCQKFARKLFISHNMDSGM